MQNDTKTTILRNGIALICRKLKKKFAHIKIYYYLCGTIITLHMKRLLLILLSALSLTALAQNQKIALLEPRAGEESAAISGMEKAMVRGELRKAIVNHTGYEAFTRADIDQMMKEQDFQRTGNVSEEDIHRMGEMSGADYLCISTLNKSSDEFYLEAYLINVETGAISNPASQYGELVNGKLANMLPVCQALAQELLGTTSPIAQPVIKPTTPKQQSVTVVSKKSVGEVKVFPDGSRGIIFYMTSDGHGLAVSLDETKLKWENAASQYKCHDISDLPNEKEKTYYMTYQLGLQNTNAVLQELGELAPAAYWCAQHGEGWYLPSVGELWYLFHEANEAGLIPKKGAYEQKVYYGPISSALRDAGGRPFSFAAYSTSTEFDIDDIYVVLSNGKISKAEKPDWVLVRAVRSF